MRDRPAALALALALAGVLVLAPASPAVEPKQPATPEEIIAYHDSGEWAADTTAVVDKARAYLESHLAPRAAIVLDVDDTSLSSYDCLRRTDFDRKALGQACVEDAEMPAIPQTLGLFDFARSKGVSVFFITGRRARQRSATISNLRAQGYRGTWSLTMRPNRQPRSQRSGWKARVRRTLVKRGYRIVVNVGDQYSDLRGGSALKTFKLPNPMYTIPVA